MSLPKVSVCIPVRNGGRFLPLAVESVLEQSFSDFELIVIDNCSTDGTAEWMEQRISAKVRFFRNPRNLGLVGNFNACLARAAGRYIKFLCADDLLLPDCLQRMSAALDANRSVTLVVGGRRLIDERGQIIASERFSKSDITVPGSDVINRCLFGANYIGEPSAVMFRKDAAQRGFRESLSHLIDLEMWFHLLEQGNMLSLHDEVCAVRRHPDQMSRRALETGALVDDNVVLFDEYGEKPYIRNTLFNLINRRARMAYRVWMCKNALSVDKRDRLLAGYSSRLFYHALMPILAQSLLVWRKSALLWRLRRDSPAE